MQLWPPVEEKKTRDHRLALTRRPPDVSQATPAKPSATPTAKKAHRSEARWVPDSDALRGHPFN